MMDGQGDLSSVFAILANDDRLALLRELLKRHNTQSAGASITTLAELAGVSRFSASRHLHLMRAVGLVVVERRGPSAIHRLDTSRFEEIDGWLYPFLDEATKSPPSAGES